MHMFHYYFLYLKNKWHLERTDSDDSENENNINIGNNTIVINNKIINKDDDTPSVASQFGNFNGFSSDKDDGTNNALENL